MQRFRCNQKIQGQAEVGKIPQKNPKKKENTRKFPAKDREDNI